MSTVLNISALGRIIDDHIGWYTLWHRLAFIEISSRAEQAKQLEVPPNFAVWRRGASALSHEQPAIDRLSNLHDQLHKLARLVLIKTPDNQPVDAQDYASLTTKYQEFLSGVRQMERAFSTASSGLDLLTGLRSRVGMMEDLGREYNRFKRGGKPFCLAIMDVDHFKSVNDTYGHDAGDRVLAAVADLVSRSLRAFDDAYRMGGEEFLLCLKEIDLMSGLTVLERLRLSLSQLPITLTNGTKINVTASFGLTIVTRETTVEQQMKKADEALYRAKNMGRNQIVVGDTTPAQVGDG